MSRARSRDRSALPNDFLRPYRGYGNIRMWDYSGYADYKALQTSVTRRFDRGFMFSGFWVWSKAQGINSTDFAAGVPNLSEEETRRLDYSLLDYDRTHNFTRQRHLPDTDRDEQQRARAPGERMAALGRLPVDERPAVYVSFSIPGIGAANLTGTDGNPNARIALTCDPGSGWSGDPYQQFTNPECFAPPQPGSKGDETPRFFARNPPLNNLDLSISKNFADRARDEVRVPARHLQRCWTRVQFTDVNNTVNFASLTDRDDHQPAVRRAGEPGAAERIRHHQRRRAAAHAAARHPPDVLEAVMGLEGELRPLGDAP